MYHSCTTGVLLGYYWCAVQMSYICTVHEYNKDVQYRCTVQVYSTGVKYICTVQVYSTAVVQVLSASTGQHKSQGHSMYTSLSRYITRIMMAQNKHLAIYCLMVSICYKYMYILMVLMEQMCANCTNIYFNLMEL